MVRKNLKPEELKVVRLSVVIVEEAYVPEPVPPTPVSYQEPRTETVYVPVEPEIVTVPAQTIDYKNRDSGRDHCGSDRVHCIKRDGGHALYERACVK